MSSVRYPRGRVLSMAVIMEGAAFLLALFLAAYFDIELFPARDNLIRDVMIGSAGAALPFVFFLFIISGRAGKIAVFHSLRKTLLSEIREVFSEAKIIDLVLISLLAGIAEEALFRGVIQARYGIITASLLFGLIHFVSPAYVMVTAVMGFYIGAFYILTGSITAPAQLHFIYDLAALMYLKYCTEA